MVKVQGTESEYDRLDRLVHEVATAHDAVVDVTGWTRKTYDVIAEHGRHEQRRLLVRVESFATTDGKVTLFDEAGMPLAEALAQRLEQDFDVREATIVRA